jgi:hypothetical protein
MIMIFSRFFLLIVPVKKRKLKFNYVAKNMQSKFVIHNKHTGLKCSLYYVKFAKF